MKNKETIQLVKKLSKHLQSEFGKWRCKELNWDCPACKYHLLDSGLDWYLNLLIWDEKTTSKTKKQ